MPGGDHGQTAGPSERLHALRFHHLPRESAVVERIHVLSSEPVAKTQLHTERAKEFLQFLGPRVYVLARSITPLTELTHHTRPNAKPLAM